MNAKIELLLSLPKSHVDHELTVHVSGLKEWQELVVVL